MAALVREVELHLLDSRHVQHPAADARELVAAVLEVPRSWPVLHASAPAGDELRAAVMAAAGRLAAGAPMQYAVGRAAFRNLVLDVDPRVLIPRPETELLVELVLDADGDRPGGTVVDVGTGSGAIAISLATEGRYDRIIAIDVSQDALAVASGAAIAFIVGRGYSDPANPASVLNRL